MKAKKKGNGNKPKGKDAQVIEGITYDDMVNALTAPVKNLYRGAKKGARTVQRGLDKAPAVMMDAAMGAVEGYGNLGKQLYQTGKLLAGGDKEKYGLKANKSYKAEQAEVEANKKKAEAEGKAYREKVEKERSKGFKRGGKMYGKKGMKVKKYQDGGMNGTGETRRGLRPKNPLSQEEIAKLGRQRRSEAAREENRKMSYSNAGTMVIDSPFHSASQSQAKIDFRQKKALAEMGVEGLAKFFGSEMYKGKGPKPSREQIEKFVTKYSK